MNSGILVRSDAGIRTGTGHVMRCLALAQVCQESDIEVALASAQVPEALVDRWRSEGSSFYPFGESAGGLADAEYTAELSQKLRCRWVVVDGYHFGSEYQRRLKNYGCSVLCLDDYGHAQHYYADFVLNQNAYADRALYPSIEPTTRLLLGPLYILLRREFRDRAPCRRRSIPIRASKILVTMGGSDPDNATQTVLESLRLLSDASIEARVVIGGTNPNAPGLVATADSLPLSVETIRDSSGLSDLMAWADFAVAAGGTTAWELAFMGVPFLAVVIAANQELVAKSLEEHHVAINLGPTSDLRPERLAREIRRLADDYARRLQMSQTGQDLFDGQGAYRVLQVLGLILLRLHRAREEDSRILWEWANEPDVRRLSFSSGPISWEDHQQWYARRINDPDSAIWIARNADDQAVGQIRFDCQGDDAVHISISVAAGWRGRGFGRELIAAGLRKASRVFPGRLAHALIKRENEASVRAFEAAGFVLAGEETIQGSRAFRYVSQPALQRSASLKPRACHPARDS